MIPSERTAAHPGVILLKEFLEPLEITPKGPTNHLGIPVQRINEIVRGTRGMTPGTVWLLSEALHTSPEFWLNLQSTQDLSAHRPGHHIQPRAAPDAEHSSDTHSPGERISTS